MECSVGSGPDPGSATYPGWIEEGALFDESAPVIAAVRAGNTRPSVARFEDLLEEVT